MSFTPRNVSQLLVAKTDVSAAYNAASTAAAKKATLVNVGDYAVVASPSKKPSTAGVSYKINNSAGLIVKTATGIKVSEQLTLGALDSYVESELTTGVNRKLTLTYPTGDAVANVTYNATAILHDHIGSMLNERFIEAYVVTDANGAFTKTDGTLGAATLTAILAELASILQASFNQNGELYTVTSTATTLAVEQLPIAQRVGFVDGINNTFELTGKRIDSTINGGVYSAVIAPVTVTANGKINDLVQLKNLEWFISGYDKDPYRDSSTMTAFPADSNVGAAGIAIGDFISIYQFHKDRDAVNVERQHRQLIVVGKNTGTKATGTVTLSGAAGSVNSIKVGGVTITSGAVNFTTDLATTAAAVAANINAFTSSPDYTAASVGAVITITAALEGSTANGLAVLTTATTLTAVDVNMSGGASDGHNAIKIALDATSVSV